MKLIIASDIHGSALYCEKLISRFSIENADRMLLLGDLLYHGPRNDLPDGYAPKKVIPMLNELKTQLLCVRGNCEAEVDQMVLDFPVLADYALLELEARTVSASHGHHHSFDNLPPLTPGSIFAQGHTHVPKCIEQNGILCINPGSVSIPKEASPRGYILLDSGKLVWKTLDGECYMEHSL